MPPSYLNASPNKLQDVQDRYQIMFRTLHSLFTRITCCHIACLANNLYKRHIQNACKGLIIINIIIITIIIALYIDHVLSVQTIWEITTAYSNDCGRISSGLNRAVSVFIPLQTSRDCWHTFGQNFTRLLRIANRIEF